LADLPDDGGAYAAGFQRLTDPTAEHAPQRVDIVQVSQRTTIEALARQRPSPVSSETLARINQVELQTPFASGRLVKWVVGQPLPGATSARTGTQ
jgi:hypothetical protein